MYKNMRLGTQDITTSTPSHALLSPSDNNKVLEFMNFNDLGSSSLTASSAFKKVQSASKANHASLFENSSDLSLKYNKIYDLYVREGGVQGSRGYGTVRQHNYGSKLTTTNNFNSLLDEVSAAKIISYNKGIRGNVSTSSTKGINIESNPDTNYLDYTTGYVSKSSQLNSEFVSNLSRNYGKLNIQLEENLDLSNHISSVDKLNSLNNNLDTLSHSKGNDTLYREGSLKSPNQSTLPGDRTVRNIDFSNPTKLTNPLNNNLVTGSGLLTPNNISKASLGNESESKILSSSTHFPEAHAPSSELSNQLTSLSFDKFTGSGGNSSLFLAKEELAPSFIFQPF